MPVNHIAVIVDGNRRYAVNNGMNKFQGHYQGAKKIDDFLDWSLEFGINEVTLYVLSTENLKRTKEELDALFKLFIEFFNKYKNDKRIEKNKLKIRFIGDLSLVPENIAKLARELEEKTKNNNKKILNFCFGYGGRLELVKCFNSLKNKSGVITEKDITNNLWLSSEPDLIIRTGGNKRTSNFLPWQSVYSEWFFIDKMWPDFKKQDLKQILDEFETIKRNFGK
jgi:tritrans,polycis-undecaprenyl-diphosphate synthase [geranylgeranyl-diphosphate specific]